MTSYDHNVKNKVNLCPLLHFRSPEKSNTAATLTHGRPKAECRGILQLGGIAAGVFLKAHGWGFQKSPVLHLGRAEVPQILPQNPKIWVITTNHPII